MVSENRFFGKTYFYTIHPWQGRHLGGGTASTDTKKTSVGWAAPASSAGYRCDSSRESSVSHIARKWLRKRQEEQVNDRRYQESWS